MEPCNLNMDSQRLRGPLVGSHWLTVKTHPVMYSVSITCRSRPNSADVSLFKPFPLDGDLEDARPRSLSYQQLNEELPPFPENLKGLSPSPTNPTSGRRSEQRMAPVLQSYPDYISDTGQPIGSPMRQSPVTVQTLPEPPRKRKSSSSRCELIMIVVKILRLLTASTRIHSRQYTLTVTRILTNIQYIIGCVLSRQYTFLATRILGKVQSRW